MAQQHKFRKAKSLFSTTLVNPIGTGTSEEIILSSTSGLPTDTEITLTFNRVDSNGDENTSDKMERITGIIDSSNLVSYTRGVDNSTEQTHVAGTVIEYIWNADDLNDLVDGILTEHDQDGTHNTDKVVDLDTAQTLENKTLTAPIISTISNTGTLTLPTSTDTLVGRATSDTLTNKTLTTPVINGAITGTITPPLTFYGANFNPPEGYMINGKIVPSVDSNNLTVALKTLAGNDPSATNPIYVRIGDTVHSITSALSVTKNAGTNWFNAGSSEFATKEIDYFVYLGYNATDGVVIGFSRVHYGRDYNDFSTTTTDNDYCAISTTTNAASGDDYTVIGRFAATLSAGAGYTWTVPTFTSKNLIQSPNVTYDWGRYIFKAQLSGDQTTVANLELIGFDTVIYDVAGTYSTANSYYVIPKTGVYEVSIILATSVNTADKYVGCIIQRNSTNPQQIFYTHTSNTANHYVSGSYILNFRVGDNVRAIYATSDGGNSTVKAGSYFMGKYLGSLPVSQ